MKTRYLRYSMLTLVLGIVLYQAFGYGTRSFEALCPFGGVESLWGLFTEGQFSCALGPLNLSIFIAIVLLAIISKKTFCGWVCPIGFIGEIAMNIHRYFFRKSKLLKPKNDHWLKTLRYLVLVVVLYYTYHLGDLIFRGFDPYYIIFSGFGHGTLGWISILSLAIFLLGSFFFPMFFCKYLCPLGATLDPFSRIGIIRVWRNAETCTDCGKCQKVCPHLIPVQNLKSVKHRDCTNCLECVDACPIKDTLELKAKL